MSLVKLNGGKVEATILIKEIQSIESKYPYYEDFNNGYINVCLKNGNKVKINYTDSNRFNNDLSELNKQLGLGK